MDQRRYCCDLSYVVCMSIVYEALPVGGGGLHYLKLLPKDLKIISYF